MIKIGVFAVFCDMLIIVEVLYMNNEFDDFSNIIDDEIKIEREKKTFELTQLKLEHYHWNSGDIDVGMPVTTSLELKCEYNFESQKLDWKKTISHTYLSLEDYHNHTTSSYTEIIENFNIIKEIEKYDLRGLKNNYFTDENPDRFTHWELTYNNYFKISGTYDQEIEAYVKISELLGFKEIIETETKKIQEKLEQLQD